MVQRHAQRVVDLRLVGPPTRWALVQQARFVQQLIPLEHPHTIKPGLIETEHDPQPILPVLALHPLALGDELLQGRKDVIFDHGRSPAALILPGEEVIDPLPGCARRRAPFADQSQVGDGQQPSIGGAGFVRGGTSGLIAERVQLFDIANLEPGLALHPTAKSDVEGTVLRLEQSRRQGRQAVVTLDREHARRIVGDRDDDGFEADLDLGGSHLGEDRARMYLDRPARHDGTMNPIALVTGGYGGIGREISIALRDAGHTVLATTRDPSRIAPIDGVQALALNVTDPASVAALAEGLDRVDVLVNNAGLQIGGAIETIDPADVEWLLAVNVVGPLRLVQAVAAQMRARGSGAIVSISSVAGRIGQPLQGAYAASKHALEALTEALYFELGHFGIRVAIIEPGFVGNGMTVVRDSAVSEPYVELDRQMAGLDEAVTGGSRSDPKIVAGVVLEALSTDEPKLRWPAGPDAEMILGARASLSDEDFEAAMRQLLDLDW